MPQSCISFFANIRCLDHRAHASCPDHAVVVHDVVSRKARLIQLRERNEALQKVRAELDAAGKNLIEGIADEKRLQSRIGALNAAITGYEAESERLEKLHKKASDGLTSLQQAIRGAEAELQKAQKAFTAAEETLWQALRDGGYADLAAVKAQLATAEERRRILASTVSVSKEYINRSFE